MSQSNQLPDSQEPDFSRGSSPINEPSLEEVPILYEVDGWPQQFLTPPRLTADKKSYFSQLHVVARDENKATGKNEDWVFTPASSPENRKQGLALSQYIIAGADKFIHPEDKGDFIEAVQGIAGFFEGWLVNDSASFDNHRERRKYMDTYDEPHWVLKKWLQSTGRLNINGSRGVNSLIQNIGFTGFVLPESMRDQWKIIAGKSQNNIDIIDGKKPLTDSNEPKRYQDWSSEDKILFGSKAEELAMEALQFLAKQVKEN